MKINNFIDDLVGLLVASGKISKRAARKFAIDLMISEKLENEEIANNIKLADTVVACPNCNKLDFVSPCNECLHNEKTETVSVFTSHIDALEVGRFSPDGMASVYVLGTGDKNKKLDISNIDFEKLNAFVKKQEAKEVVLMFDKTTKNEVVGDYIKSYFSNSKIKVSTLAVGVSLGTSIEYLDGQTIQLALKNREKK